MREWVSVRTVYIGHRVSRRIYPKLKIQSEISNDFGENLCVNIVSG